MITLTARFLNYVSFDTQSADNSDKTPSTEKQLELTKFLKKELENIGMKEVETNEYGFVYATLPANTDKNTPTVGFIAHIDTSPDCSGANIKPRIISNYDGTNIVLSEGLVSSPDKFPELLNHIGDDIIVTDGTTLLGADDKAGITEIVTACEYLINHPEIKHGKVRVAFTPDEELGTGVHKFDIEKFNADFAFTVDGSEVGELEYECFNAAMAKVIINGVSVHPGFAKGKMVNAARIAAELVGLLPEAEIPEHTDDYEGFYHLLELKGNCENATLSFIIRDHDREIFEKRKKYFKDVVNLINAKYGNVADLDLKDQYYNMKEYISESVVDLAAEAMKMAGITPVIKPIRGGTDGSLLSRNGLQCPNLFAGGINFHGPFEFLPVQSMEKAMQTIINIITLNEQNSSFLIPNSSFLIPHS